MNDMVIKKFRLEDLNPAKYNPRKKLKPGDKEFEKLENSIRNFGYVELIVVNVANNNTVISGHQRLSVLKHLGETEAECVVVELNENEEKALNIAMNKVSGQWDETLLAQLLSELKEADFNVDLTGFEPPEMDQLMSKLYDKEVKEDDFDVEEELKQPVFSKPGDLWLIGKHRVICGDCTLREVHDRVMDGDKANLVMTDPPYNVNYGDKSEMLDDYIGGARNNNHILNDNMSDQDFHKFLVDAYTQMHDSLAKDGSIYVFHAETEGVNFRTAFIEAGFKLSSCCIWKKNSLVLGRSPYQWIHEPCLYGWRADGTHQWYSDRKQTTVWEYDRPKANKEHPTMKPIQLLAYPIRNSTMTNGIVLDPFLGSGSTMVACMETDRICRGIELDPKFVDVIVKRAIDWNNGRYDDIFVIRDGQKLTFDEVVTFEAEEAQDGE